MPILEHGAGLPILNPNRRSRIVFAATTIAACAAILVVNVDGRAQATTAPVPPPIVSAKANSVTVSAHRGGAQQWPQDSLEAYRNSLSAGYAEIEGDTWITTDGVTVIEHDDHISPTRCEGPYVGHDIWTLSSAQVAQETCEGQPIPTEAQVLSLVQASGSTHTVLRLETKTYPGQSAASARAWAEQVGAQVVKAGLASRSIMQDFNWDGIAGYHAADARLRVSALVGRPTTTNVLEAQKLGAYDLSYDARYSTVTMNAYISQHHLVPTVWGVDSVPAESGPLSAAAQQKVHATARQVAATADRVMIVNSPALVIQALGSSVSCTQALRTMTSKTITPSSHAGNRVYFHTLSTAPWGTEWVSVRVWQTAATSAHVLVTPEGLSAGYGRDLTLKRGKPVTIPMRAVEYFGVRADSAQVPASGMHLMTVGDYPLSCN